MTWSEVEQQSPACAAVAARLWPGIFALHRGEPVAGPCFSIAYLATTRPDGAPRLHPFCPIVAAGSLFAAIPMPSPKGNDLRRDPRCVIHALPGPSDDELCIRARAFEIGDASTLGAVRAVVGRSGVGGMIESVRHDPIFEFDIERVDVARWVDVGRPGTYAERAHWAAAGAPPRRRR